MIGISTLLLALQVAAHPSLAPRQVSVLDASFQAPTASDARSPCPGLNTLANHGFIPRNGRAITPQMIGAAAKAVYNFEAKPFEGVAKYAIRMLNAINMTAVPGTVDLDALRTHNILEHDASLSRDDVKQGNNFAVNPALVQQLVTLTPGDSLTVKDFGYIRAVRNVQSQSVGSPPLEGRLNFAALVETSLVMNVHGRPGPDGVARAPKDLVRYWFLNERLPGNWTQRRHTSGNLDFLGDVRTVNAAQKKVKFSNAPPGSKNAPKQKSLLGFLLGKRESASTPPVKAPAAAGAAAQVASPATVAAAPMAMPAGMADDDDDEDDEIMSMVDMNKIKRDEYDDFPDEDSADPKKWRSILAMHGMPLL